MTVSVFFKEGPAANASNAFLLNSIYTRLFVHPICTLPKNCLVSDRSKIFCLLKLVFVKLRKKNF